MGLSNIHCTPPIYLQIRPVPPQVSQVSEEISITVRVPSPPHCGQTRPPSLGSPGETAIASDTGGLPSYGHNAFTT